MHHVICDLYYTRLCIIIVLRVILFPVDNKYHVRAPRFVSDIGSVPEHAALPANQCRVRRPPSAQKESAAVSAVKFAESSCPFG